MSDVAPLNYNKQPEKTPMPELDPVYRATCFEEVALGYTLDDAINEARRCMQCVKKPCVAGCPVGVPIPEFIGHIAEGDIATAYAYVKDANALPAICGRVCPQESQCEGVCTRGRRGEPVGIGRLERFVADWAFEHPEEGAAALAQKQESDEAVRAEMAADLGAGALDGVEIADADSQGREHDVIITADKASELIETGDVPTIPAGLDLTGFKVACVGSGPASLTCAGELAKHGASVTVFEAFHKVGGVLVYGIPEFRLPKALVAQEVAALEELGVTFEVNAVIGKLYTIEELMGEMGFDAVFIGTGAGLPTYLGIEGEALNGVSVANELLTRVNLMKAYRHPEYDTPVFSGERCIVVGGGNVAMDAARTAKRLGADVTIVYRRSREEMPARAEEIHHAEQEGIHFELLTNPLRLIGDDQGWITGAEVVSMELGEPDASGRRRPIPIEGSEHVLPCDMFVIAVGSRTNPLLGDTTPGLETTPRHLIVADDATCATSVPGIFAGGDAVIGAATVILAMGAGKRAAAGIADYLTGL